MKEIRVGLVGSTGRMGTSLLQLLEQPEFGSRFELVYASGGPKDPEFTMMAALKPQVIIDFSAPKASLATAALCARHGIPHLICTTGFTPKEQIALEKHLRHTPWAQIPNTSLGVHGLHQAVAAALAALPKKFRVSIVETHHVHKKDRPSGTAKSLAHLIANQLGGEPEIETIREGEEIGEHRVVIEGPGERLELTHKALDRSLFARGALELASKLVDRATSKDTPGRPYTLAELMAFVPRAPKKPTAKAKKPNQRRG